MNKFSNGVKEPNHHLSTSIYYSFRNFLLTISVVAFRKPLEIMEISRTRHKIIISVIILFL